MIEGAMIAVMLAWQVMVGLAPAFVSPAWWDRELVRAGYAQAPPTGCYFLKEQSRWWALGALPHRTSTVLCFARPNLVP